MTAPHLGRVRRPRTLGLLAVTTVIVAVGVLVWSSRPPASPTQIAAGGPFPASGVVVTEGGPPPQPGYSDVRPDSHDVLMVRGTTVGGTHLSRAAMTDRHGRFALRLPPGTYTITAVMFGGSTRTAGQPQARVTIRRGHPVRVRITAHVN